MREIHRENSPVWQLFYYLVLSFTIKIITMPTTYKFKFTVNIKTSSGAIQTIHPIVEAESAHEAKVMNQSQYPNITYMDNGTKVN
jgi:hypothetical protein